MQRRFLALGLAMLGAFVLAQLPPASSQEKKAEKKPEAGKKQVSFIVQVPQANATLSVDGQVTKESGSTRKFKSPALDPKGTYTYTLKVVWEPNNYTKITRKHVVKFDPSKESEIMVDLTKADDRWKDDIVVRYVPTPNEVVDAMCKLGKVTKEDVVYDLGCGDGRMVIRAVDKFHAKKGVGVDIDAKLVKECKENAKTAGVDDKVEFRQGDVLKIDDLPDASVVLLYMGNDINLRLRPILQSKLKPGSRVVSHRFTMGDWEPHTTQTINVDGEDYQVHLWIIGQDNKKK